MKKGCKIAITIVGVALVVVLLRGCVATSYLIPSSGMENSLYQSERILVNKWSYGLRLPFMKLWGIIAGRTVRCRKRIFLYSTILPIFQNP